MYYPYIDKYEFYENLPIYILITIILIIISIFVYIKIAFPFWNIQPVYHSYDFWRALYRQPFIIQKRFLIKNTNKYHHLKNVEIVPFVDATDLQKREFVNLLQCFLLPSENAVFVFNIENLETYFGGHMFSSYISFYKEEYSDQPNACISSRSGELYIKGYNEYHNDNMGIPINYIDFLCIKRDEQTKKISRTLLQTHIYKQQLIDSYEGTKYVGSQIIMVSVFRRETELLVGIVPLTRFKTVYYDMPNINNQNQKQMPEHVLLIEINAANMDTMIDFLDNYKSRFECFLRTDIANLIGMIKSGILYVYCLKRMDDIYGVYIFRDTRTSYDGLGGVLQLVGSINNCSSHLIFINGFVNSILEIIKKVPVYKVLMIDEISDNIILMNMKMRIINSHWSAYYLYNMVSNIRQCSQVFVLF